MLVTRNCEADLFAAGGGHTMENASPATDPFLLEAIIAVYKVQWSITSLLPNRTPVWRILYYFTDSFPSLTLSKQSDPSETYFHFQRKPYICASI